MIVTARACWAPKAGNRPDEYEDAFWPPNSPGRGAAPGAKRSARARRALAGGSVSGCQPGADGARFAVADGATETSFAGLWAQRLVRAYGAGWFDGDDWAEHLRREQAAWQAEVLQKPLPWYAEAKVRAGAYAALLGLQLRAAGEWSAALPTFMLL